MATLDGKIQTNMITIQQLILQNLQLMDEKRQEERDALQREFARDHGKRTTAEKQEQKIAEQQAKQQEKAKEKTQKALSKALANTNYVVQVVDKPKNKNKNKNKNPYIDDEAEESDEFSEKMKSICVINDDEEHVADDVY